MTSPTTFLVTNVSLVEIELGGQELAASGGEFTYSGQAAIQALLQDLDFLICFVTGAITLSVNGKALTSAQVSGANIYNNLISGAIPLQG